MTDALKYRVIPQVTNPQPVPNIDRIPLTYDEEKSVEYSSQKEADEGKKHLGCIAGIVSSVIIIIGAKSAFPDLNIIGIVCGAILAGFVFWVWIDMKIIEVRSSAIRRSRTTDLEREKATKEKVRIENANQNEIRRANDEASSLTNALTNRYTISTKLASNLPQYLNNASGWLRQAQKEYNDNAFSPFWDAVENVAINLSVFNDEVKELSRNAIEYYRMLEGKEHTFPAFPANMGTIPDPSSVVNELRRTVRMGQTNFQFANIWEHRRTREVLIAGFRTLGEAVNNLGGAIEYSVSNLQQSVSSDVAKLVEEEIKTRETFDKRMLEQNQLLDNIQHHRN